MPLLLVVGCFFVQFLCLYFGRLAMSYTPHTANARFGFTMLELIAVLIIIGILSMWALSSLDDSSYQLSAAKQLLLTRIRYAQSRSMSQDTHLGIVCTGSSYALFSGDSKTNRLHFPDASDTSVDLPSGITCTSFVISFDAWGNPYSKADNSEAYSETKTITLSQNGTSQTITLIPVTGYVQ